MDKFDVYKINDDDNDDDDKSDEKFKGPSVFK